MKLLFASGPGDVVGSYRAWKAGREDERVPVRTYANMFFEVAEAYQAETMVIHSNPMAHELDEGRIHIRALVHGHKTGLMAYSWDKFQAARRYAEMINDFDPDFAILSSNVPFLVPRFLKPGIAVHFTMHNTFWPMGNPGIEGPVKTFIRNRFRHATIPKFHGAICTSEECRRQLLPFIGPEKPVLVERPVLSSAVTLRAPVGRVRRLIYVGRVARNKGIFMLLEAFERLAARDADLSLVFVGDGLAYADLQRRVAASPLADRITVTGRLTAPDVHAQLAQSDLLVCPTMTSFFEGLALVGLEAAAHGVPSIVSSVVPAQDVLGDACRVFPADDTAALEALLARIIEDPALYGELVQGAERLAGLLADGSESWGVQLRRLIEQAVPEHAATSSARAQ